MNLRKAKQTHLSIVSAQPTIASSTPDEKAVWPSVTEQLQLID